jgi:hypothetical protein
MSNSSTGYSLLKFPRQFIDDVKGFFAPFASRLLHVPSWNLFDAGQGITPSRGKTDKPVGIEVP